MKMSGRRQMEMPGEKGMTTLQVSDIRFTMNNPIRYAIVGLGGRHEMYRDAIVGPYSSTSRLVGLCDSNEGRLRLAVDAVAQTAGSVPGYSAREFDRMITETKPDWTIVTSMDSTHDHYICRSLELGCDVITEKPMTIDDDRCRKIIKTVKSTGRKCRVTFNYRYSPPRSQIKELLMSGVIGEILSVDFHWMLDLSHGADYFRRWHRNHENSGGLLVHKATHHFDLVNWWLSPVPESVYAEAQRKFYTPETAERYGLTKRGERCYGCPESERCAFYLGLDRNPNLRKLYLDCEAYDGYYRDKCVFSSEIDIPDCMTLVVSYRNGAKMSYSLNAFCPWEGHVVVFNGTRGRIEHKCEETVYINADGSVPGALNREGTWTRVYPHWEPAYEIEIWEAEGGHGGGDELLLEDLFGSDNKPDKYLRAADYRAGAWSILTGIAANHSIRETRPVRIDELVTDLDLPEFPEMPDGAGSLVMKKTENPKSVP